MNTIITPDRFIKYAVNGNFGKGQAVLDLLIVIIIKNWLSTVYVTFIQQ